MVGAGAAARQWPSVRVALSAGVALLGLGVSPPAALAYEVSAAVTFSWATDGISAGWTANGTNFLATVSDDTYLTTLSGKNQTTYYNPDFARPVDANGWCGAGSEPFQAQYACKVGTSTPLPTPATGNLGPGAAATGVLTVTDTTMTGTLTVINTNDEGAGPQPGTTAATGYNIRTADGSPFKNAWYGVSSQATLTVNLTGTFTATSWEITGGTVAFSDPAFQCAVADFSGVLCALSSLSGGVTGNGSFLSWGLDVRNVGATEIPVYDASGAVILSSLAGVRASVVVDAGGTITTTQGEFRNAFVQGPCPAGLRYNGTGLSCGALQAGLLAITGAVGESIDRPDPFFFTDLTGVEPSTAHTSNTIAVTGLAAPAAVSVVGGQYSIGCTATFTGAAGEVATGDTVCVRVTSAATSLASASATLTIGGVSDTFTVTTRTLDTRPDQFSIPQQSDVPLASVVTSVPVTITGFSDPATVTVSNGSYSVGCTGTFTTAQGLIAPGSTICVRHTSAASTSSSVFTQLSIGGVQASFRSTTRSFQAVDDSAVTAAGAAEDINVLANDQGFCCSINLGILRSPLNGTVAIVGGSSGQVIRYQPAPGFLGTDTFEYAVDGGNNRIDIATVTVEVILDADRDDVADATDNCTLVANANQRDSDGDGFGNACDADLDNDGRVNFADLGLFRQRFTTTDPHADFDGNGVVNFADLGTFRTLFGRAPGPSALVP